MIWSPTDETDNNVARLYFKKDGSLGVYREDGSTVWTFDTSTIHPQKLVLENDGRLVLYDNESQNVWDSSTADKCGKGKYSFINKASISYERYCFWRISFISGVNVKDNFLAI